jgi:hypothetical protein
MNTFQISVRLDAEHHTAELEILAPQRSVTVQDLKQVLGHVGVLPLRTIETFTPRYHVTRARVMRRDGVALDTAVVLRILGAVQDMQRSALWSQTRMSA